MKLYDVMPNDPMHMSTYKTEFKNITDVGILKGHMKQA